MQQMMRLGLPVFASVILLLSSVSLSAQRPARITSAQIHQGIKKLNMLGTALYLAAHPDDENTRMIAYLANEKKARTAYLSLTRGDGGQNLISPDIRELLGVIRTQELLGARRIDGGQQFFSRANDFGYSKNPEETLKIWEKKEVMKDVVYIIRKFKPDVIINRFSHDSGRRTHGHHTSSAMLSFEAFDLVGDPEVYPELSEFVDPWQPSRLFFNTSWWFYGSREKFAKADKSRMMSVDVGSYYPWFGKSNNEVAAESRSQHKSQGFGSTHSRGSQLEYLQLLKGEMPDTKEDPFAGINTTWSRVKGAPATLPQQIEEIANTFRYDNPAESVPALLGVRKVILDLPDGHWKGIKLEELDHLIAACMGLYLEATSDTPYSSPGSDIELTLEMLNRSEVSTEIKQISYLPLELDTMVNTTLPFNEEQKIFRKISLPANMSYSNPYWLNDPASLGMYTVTDQTLRGLPETPRPLQVQFDLTIGGQAFTFVKPIEYKSTDPVKGETYRPFEVLPPAFVQIADPVYVLAENEPKTIEVKVTAGQPNISTTVSLNVAGAKGFTVSPSEVTADFTRKGESQTFNFQVSPPAGQAIGRLTANVTTGGKTYARELIELEHDHFPKQMVLREAQSKIVKVDLKKRGERLGYVMGAGDDIPRSLEQVGYQVDLLTEADMKADILNQYDAIIIGIRAYNTETWMPNAQKHLLEYVNNGGTMVVQYNTGHRLKVPSDELGPYPFKVSRDRVAVEEAEVRFLAPEHPVLNTPNKITPDDFQDWVQERGLYFPNEWDEHYTPILSSNDPNEPARDGGLLVTTYGKGYYVYSGYSWFRELPAGVPGAYRLFTNLISLRQE